MCRGKKREDARAESRRGMKDEWPDERGSGCDRGEMTARKNFHQGIALGYRFARRRKFDQIFTASDTNVYLVAYVSWIMRK